MAKLDQKVVDACRAASKKYNVPLPTMIGIVVQESAGVFTNYVNGHLEPTVRFEGHYFDKRLSGDARTRARSAGLSSPSVGGVKNPSSQQDRWNKLILPAMKLNEAGAIESISWGLGQVMGAHWQKLGFKSAKAFADYVRKGITEQVDVMFRYCDKFDLLDEIRRGDMRGFVRGYNGSGRLDGYTKELLNKIAWARSEYSTAADEKKVVNGVPASKPAAAKKSLGMLRMGVTHDARVREAQELMHRDGIAVNVDGDFGPATKRAVETFQKKHKLTVDGVIGPATWAAIQSLRVDSEEQPGIPGVAEALVQTPEGRQGGFAAITGISVSGAITAAQDQLQGLVGNGGIIDNIFAGLTIAGVVATVGGLIWSLYGWAKAKRISKLVIAAPETEDVVVPEEIEQEAAAPEESATTKDEMAANLAAAGIALPRGWGRMKPETAAQRYAELMQR